MQIMIGLDLLSDWINKGIQYMRKHFRLAFVISFVCSFSIHFAASQPVPASYFANLPFSMPEVQVPIFPDRTLNILEYGAVADGQTMNTKAFMSAIEACTKAGGGKVLVPAGVWLTGPIRFESNINLYLEKGAVIMFSRNRADYPLVPYPTPASKAYICANPIYGYKLENIAITGDGVIDGSGEVWRPMKKEKYTTGQWKKITTSGGVVSEDGKMWWPSRQALDGDAYLKNLRKEKKSITIEDLVPAKDFLRSNMVVFYGCNKVLLDGPTFRNSPKFCVNPVQCENLVIRNITVQNDWNAQNGDGIDIGSSHNVVIYNCVVDAGDDAICLKPGTIEKGRDWKVACENIVVADCIIYHGHGGFVIGSETYGGTKNISVRNCTFIGTDVGLRFKSSRNRGGITENIYIDGIQMKDIVNEAILFDMYYEDDKPEAGADRISAPVTDRTPLFQKFYIRNVVCNGAEQAIFIQGLPEQFAREIEMTNITISSRKGITCIDAEGLTFNNVNVTLSRGQIFDIDNAKNIKIANFAFTGGADLFMKVVGKQSENIQLVKTDISKAKKDYEFEKGAEAKSVIQK
jgi:polygalacturonase